MLVEVDRLARLERLVELLLLSKLGFELKQDERNELTNEWLRLEDARRERD